MRLVRVTVTRLNQALGKSGAESLVLVVVVKHDQKVVLWSLKVVLHLNVFSGFKFRRSIGKQWSQPINSSCLIFCSFIFWCNKIFCYHEEKSPWKEDDRSLFDLAELLQKDPPSHWHLQATQLLRVLSLREDKVCILLKNEF